MLHVEEQRPGVIEVEVELTPTGELLGERQPRPVQVLAAQQWLATPLPLALEMLAALRACPTTRRSPRWSSEAADLLEQKTGSGALVGYAATPERVDEVVAGDRRGHARAAASATASRRVSWSDLGQQVRTPGDVLTWRVGTPLDTVVVLAAALEQAGIRPLLWLADGHAFLGYWREERSAESAATTDAAPLVNLVDLGLIGLVETTLLTSDGRARRRPAPPRLHRLADRRARPDPRRHRRPPRPPRRHPARCPRGPGTPAASCRSSSTGRPSTAPRRRREPAAAGAVEPARGAAAGAAVEERAARPQPAQPADQLHRAVRAARWPCPARVARRLENFVHDGTPITPAARPTSWPRSRRSAG